MTVRFLFIFGWLRVAETLYNPFGEDDDDFELNELLNRHFKVAMTIVDDMEDPPELKKDIFWNQVSIDADLGSNVACVKMPSRPPPQTCPELLEMPEWAEVPVQVDLRRASHGRPELEVRGRLAAARLIVNPVSSFRQSGRQAARLAPLVGDGRS